MAITAPVPFSCAPVTIVPVPSGLSFTYAPGVRGEARPPAARDADRLVLGEPLARADQLDRALERLLHRDPLENLARRGDGPSSISVRRRSSTGSSPSASASSSMCCSSAQQTCGAVGARIDDEGWLFE